ncbi:MAG: InlB B-repeat-containing protein [Treponema sp.]|nr:InlB B-repeat-containing protein [Treponema sp.]
MNQLYSGKLLFSQVIIPLLIISCANPFITQIAEPKTVSFETNGGNIIDSQTVYRNYPVQRPANPLRDAHTFEDWYTDNVTFTQSWDFNTIPSDHITLYANWTPIYNITVSFNSNGAEADPPSITVIYGGLITAPVPPVKDGYGFAGWYREPECITEWNFLSDIVTEDLTLHAKWIHNCITIALDIDEITSDQSPQIDAVIISRTGADGLPTFSLIKIDPNQFDTGSITWRISGIGAYAGTFITDDDDPATGTGEFLLNANDTRYNAFGTHTLLLEVKKDGITYRTNIIFTVVN